jgi:hypothetical protein
MTALECDKPPVIRESGMERVNADCRHPALPECPYDLFIQAADHPVGDRDTFGLTGSGTHVQPVPFRFGMPARSGAMNDEDPFRVCTRNRLRDRSQSFTVDGTI